MKPKLIDYCLYGLVLFIVLIIIPINVIIPHQKELMCDACYKQNWTGNITGEVSFNCEEYTGIKVDCMINVNPKKYNPEGRVYGI